MLSSPLRGTVAKPAIGAGEPSDSLRWIYLARFPPTRKGMAVSMAAKE